MNELVSKNILRSVIICGILLVLIFSFVKIYMSIIFENRIKKFTIGDDESNKVSLFDLFSNRVNIWVKKISKFICKSHVLNDYSKFFDKYFVYNDQKNIKSIDFISIKILVTFLIDILYLLTLPIYLGKFNFMWLLLISIISFFVCDIFIIVIFKRKKSLISEQLLEAVVIMNSAFKSGKNILGSIEIVKEELPNPIKTEFTIIYNDLLYGISVEEAFMRLEKRILLDEVKLITSSLALLSRTGGNIVTVFNMIEKNFYDRLKIKNELNALTTTSKFLYRILLFVPVFLILIIVVLNPTYFYPLISTKIGFIIDFIMAFLYVIYIFIIKKVMKVDEL